MDARLNLFENPTAVKILKYVTSAGKVITDSATPQAHARNWWRCAPARSTAAASAPTCDTKDAAPRRETQQRLNLVAVWREATVFTEAERAAPELTEQGTPDRRRGGRGR